MTNSLHARQSLAQENPSHTIEFSKNTHPLTPHNHSHANFNEQSATRQAGNCSRLASATPGSQTTTIPMTRTLSESRPAAQPLDPDFSGKPWPWRPRLSYTHPNTNTTPQVNGRIEARQGCNPAIGEDPVRSVSRWARSASDHSPPALLA